MKISNENIKSIPKVEFDNKNLKISGKSIPLNKNYFDNYINELINLIKTSQNDVTIEIDLECTNAYTKKKLAEFLKKIEKLNNLNKNIKIKWYCNENNDSDYELGQILKNMTTLDFQIIFK